MATINEEVSLNGLLKSDARNENVTPEVNSATPTNGIADENCENGVETIKPATVESNPDQELNGILENSHWDEGLKSEGNANIPNGLVEKNSEDDVKELTSDVRESNGLLERNDESVNPVTPPNGLLEKCGEEEISPSPVLEVNRNFDANKFPVKDETSEKEQALNIPQIKQEDPLDIDESAPASGETKRMPIISLTPTSKLLATPNPINPKRKFVCPYENCGKSYGKSSHLRSHLTWHTGIKPFVCQEPNCGKGFTRSDELNRHVRTHTGEKPFECVQCTKKFSRSDHLTKHLATHVKQQRAPRRKIEQTDVPIKRNPKRRLGVDIGFGHLQTIVSTNRRLDTTETLHASDFLHMDFSTGKDKHEPIKIKLERPDNNSEYQIVPTSILKNNTELREESNTNHEEDVSDELIIGDDEIMPEANAPPLLPQQLDVVIKSEPEETKTDTSCPQTFEGMVDLNCHRHEPFVQIPATENNEIPHRQGLRPKPESKAQEMLKDPERPYDCKECPKTFRRQDDLQRHIRTHTGEKPFPCNECDRRFVRSDHLKKHLQTHIRVRSTPIFPLNSPTKNNS